MARTHGPRPEGARPGNGERTAEQAEILTKLPDQAPADQERGERHATGKAIATGGKSVSGDVPSGFTPEKAAGEGSR